MKLGDYSVKNFSGFAEKLTSGRPCLRARGGGDVDQQRYVVHCGVGDVHAVGVRQYRRAQEPYIQFVSST